MHIKLAKDQLHMESATHNDIRDVFQALEKIKILIRLERSKTSQLKNTSGCNTEIQSSV